MHDFSAGAGETAANAHHAADAVFGKGPLIEHIPSSDEPDAIVLQQILWFAWRAVALQISGRGADDAATGEQFAHHDARVEGRAIAQYHHAPSQLVGRADAEQATDRITFRRRFGLSLLDVAHDAYGALVQQRTFFGQQEAASVAFDETHTEPGLQRREAPAHRRRRAAELLGRLGEVARSDEVGEQFQVADLICHSPEIAPSFRKVEF